MSVTTTTGGLGLVPQTMDQAMRLAEMMAVGKLVPSHLQKSPGDCLMVIEQAMRWGMSPFAVAQSTSVIQGKLMFEGKLVAAALHASGALATRLDYEYAGEGASRMVRVSAVLAGESEPRAVEVKLADAKTTNGMWTKQPDQQLAYHGARVWARRYAPEVMLGVYAPEEMEPAPTQHGGPTIEARAEPVAAAEEVVQRPTPEQMAQQYADDWTARLDAARTYEAVNELVGAPALLKLLTRLEAVAPALATKVEAAKQRAMDRAIADAPPPVDGVYDLERGEVV